MEWYVKFRDPKEIWKNHPSFLMCEIMYFTLAFLTFVHGKYYYGYYTFKCKQLHSKMTIFGKMFMYCLMGWVVGIPPRIDNFVTIVSFLLNII